MQTQNTMGSEEVRSFLEEFFRLFADPSISADVFGRLMTPDYVQRVDGIELDFAGFIAHRTKLLEALSDMKVTFEHYVGDGRSAATVHLADVVKKNGDKVQLKVIAFYQLKDRRLSYVEELTFLVAGSHEDKNLGSAL